MALTPEQKQKLEDKAEHNKRLRQQKLNRSTPDYIALKKEESSRSGDYLEAKRWGEVVLDNKIN